MRNLTLLTDLYQLTMANSYYNNNQHEQIAVFDLFYRGVGNSYALVCGLEQVIEYIENFKFSKSDIDYLDSLNLFDKNFLNYLGKMQFTGSIKAAKEGTVLFPNEPFLIVKAPLIQAQIIETALLCIINHQTLIATKAMKIKYNSNNKKVLEFGLRRAQGPDAGIYGARAAIIGGCDLTSNVYAGKEFNIPLTGTHSHSYVMSFDTELEAFQSYAKKYPNNCTLLVDTYDTLKSGVPNAIVVFKDLVKRGYKPVGIRLDSGDLAYLSKKAREMLDSAGLHDVKIAASSDLDENILRSLESQGSRIDVYGIGTKLITSADTPSLGGVYKLAGIGDDKKYVAKMKLSDTSEKMTNPCYKKIVRIMDKKTKKAIADLICLHDEKFEMNELEIFDPIYTWKRMKIKNFYVKELLEDIYVDGKLVFEIPSINEIKRHANSSKNELWEEYIRDVNPSNYKVDLSSKLYEIKKEIIKDNSLKIELEY